MPASRIHCIKSLPARAAWIETVSTTTPRFSITSLPARAAWIETRNSEPTRVSRPSLPARAAWIETKHRVRLGQDHGRCPRGQRGLKQLQIDLSQPRE